MGDTSEEKKTKKNGRVSFFVFLAAIFIFIAQDPSLARFDPVKSLDDTAYRAQSDPVFFFSLAMYWRRPSQYDSTHQRTQPSTSGDPA